MWRSWSVVALIASSLLAPTCAFAQSTDDEDDFEFESDAPPTVPKPEAPKPDPTPKKSDPPPPPEKKAPVTPEESDDIDFEDETEPVPESTEPKPFLDDEEERDDADLLSAGTDTQTIYRAKVVELEGAASDEEVMAWEAYLQRYPNSVYRKRIEDRIEELVDEQFRMRIDGPRSTGNADEQELLFVNPMHMVNVNPRTRAFLAVEFGFPTYTQLTADFEYAFLRNVSAHAGLYGRYTGWSFDVGARYAFVKSTRLKLAATLVADVGINFNQRVNSRQEGVEADPNRIFFQARPQLAIGKIIGPAQVLISFGADIGSRQYTHPAIIGGAHVGVRVAPPVGVYVETDFFVRDLGRTGGPQHFELLSFGFKFYPMSKKTDDPMEIGMAGHIPVAQSYYQPFLGAVQVQGAYFPKLP